MTTRRGFVGAITTLAATWLVPRWLKAMPAPAELVGAFVDSTGSTFDGVAMSSYPRWQSRILQGEPLSEATLECAQAAMWDAHDRHVAAHLRVSHLLGLSW